MPASTHGLIIKYFHTQTTRTSSCTSMLNWSLWEKLTRAKCPTATVKPVAVETAERSFSHRVRAITLFFLGCWLTGLPTVLLFFSEPFRASSLCFSAEESGHTWREGQMAHRPPQRHDDLRGCLIVIQAALVPKKVLTLFKPVTQWASNASDSIISLPTRRDGRHSRPHETFLCLPIYLWSSWNTFSDSIKKCSGKTLFLILFQFHFYYKNTPNSFLTWLF